MKRVQSLRMLHGALVALALAASVLAHRVPTKTDLQIAAIQAAMGVAVNLCGDTGEDDNPGKSCEFCHIATATLLPDPMPELVAADSLILAEIILPSIRRAEALALDHARLTRGPPAA